MATPYVNASAWRELLASIWNANRNVSGAVALLSLIAQQAAQSSTKRKELAGDYFIKRGLGDWDAEFAGLMLRLDWYTAQLEHVVSVGEDDPTAFLVKWVAGPIINGDFPKGFGNDDAKLREGLTLQSDGSWSSFGDAVLSATLWNQVHEAWAADKELEASTWLPAAVLDWWSHVENDLSVKAPGEEKTTVDQVRDAVDAAKESFVAGVKTTLEAVGGGVVEVLGWAALGFGLIYGVRVLFLKRR